MHVALAEHAWGMKVDVIVMAAGMGKDVADGTTNDDTFAPMTTLQLLQTYKSYDNNNYYTTQVRFMCSRTKCVA